MQTSTFTSRKRFKITFIFFTIFGLFVLGNAAFFDLFDVKEIDFSKEVVSFGAWSVVLAYIALGLKAFKIRQGKFMNAFVVFAASAALVTMFIYIATLWDPYYTDVQNFNWWAQFIVDISVFVFLAISLTFLVVVEAVEDKFNYHWEALLYVFVVPVLYHMFLTWWVKQDGNDWPFGFLNPDKIGADELAARYGLIILGMHILGFFLIFVRSMNLKSRLVIEEVIIEKRRVKKVSNEKMK